MGSKLEDREGLDCDNTGSVGGKDSSRVLTAAWLPESLETEERQAFVVYQPHSMRRHHAGTERA